MVTTPIKPWLTVTKHPNKASTKTITHQYCCKNSIFIGLVDEDIKKISSGQEIFELLCSGKPFYDHSIQGFNKSFVESSLGMA